MDWFGGNLGKTIYCLQFNYIKMSFPTGGEFPFTLVQGSHRPASAILPVMYVERDRIFSSSFLNIKTIIKNSMVSPNLPNLHEFLETFFPGLADRAGQRRLFPRAQITAHFAAPDGIWQ